MDFVNKWWSARQEGFAFVNRIVAAAIAEVMANLMSRVRRQRGFTLNELMVAMNLIVVAVMGYSLSAVGLIRGQTANDNFTVAIHLAQDKIEQLKAQTKLVNDHRCPSAGDRGLSASGAAGGIFDRCWQVADSPLGANLKQVDVTVSWRNYENHQITVTTLIFTGEYQ
jgi:prepilin-type N-terminal cleavage/methylation domain-containing protein